jgi:TnpA family transposase
MPSVDQLDPSFRGINEDVPQALKDPVEVQKLLLTEQMKSAEARVTDNSRSLRKYFNLSRASTS